MTEVSVAKSIAHDRIVPNAGEGQSQAKITASSPIGMFDSGVGGLSVLKEVIKQMPSEDVIYFADTARLPYGGRSPQEIVKFNYEILNFLVSQGVKLVIMACGTSSSVAYPIVKDHYKIPTVSLIEPGAAAAVRETGKGRIGIIATQATIDSSAYQRAIRKIKKDADVFAAACPLFVPLIEGGFIEADETKRVALQYLKPMLKSGIDTLVLGCTHYPHLTKILREITGIKIKFIDPAEEAVSQAKSILVSKGLAASRVSAGTKVNHKYFVSGSAVQFQDLGSRLLGRPLQNVKQIALPKSGKRGYLRQAANV
ncbi:MAG: glutamate racemase [Candidatus Saganbacteria bacterium]|nr:glutamate racemase [Candidatus Saganbacteria bacterium]